MNPSVCICCGERIAEKGNALSRNPNICAACSSLADGMEEPSIASLEECAPVESPRKKNPALAKIATARYTEG